MFAVSAVQEPLQRPGHGRVQHRADGGQRRAAERTVGLRELRCVPIDDREVLRDRPDVTAHDGSGQRRCTGRQDVGDAGLDQRGEEGLRVVDPRREQQPASRCHRRTDGVGRHRQAGVVERPRVLGHDVRITPQAGDQF